jgi:hypothetical protein
LVRSHFRRGALHWRPTRAGHEKVGSKPNLMVWLGNELLRDCYEVLCSPHRCSLLRPIHHGRYRQVPGTKVVKEYLIHTPIIINKWAASCL